jgi:hypothetical protein
MSAEARRESARKAVQARWAKAKKGRSMMTTNNLPIDAPPQDWAGTKPLLVTLDMGPLIHWLGQTASFRSVGRIFAWRRQGRIQLFASSRVLNVDAGGMDTATEGALRKLISDESIVIAPSSFRINISPLSGDDVLSGPGTSRARREMEAFERIVGTSPEWSKGKRNLNRFADYDALRDHYCAKRHVFVTIDRKGYLGAGNRRRYKEALNLLIADPEEFVEDYSQAKYTVD